MRAPLTRWIWSNRRYRTSRSNSPPPDRREVLSSCTWVPMEAVVAPRLLLVEDNSDYAYLVGRMLRESWGDAAPDRAERLGDALELLRERPYDCIVLDLGLPDGQGVEAL